MFGDPANKAAKDGLNALLIPTEEIFGRYAANDVIDESTGRIWIEAGDEVSPENLEVLDKAGVDVLELLDIDSGAPVALPAMATRLGVTDRHLRRIFAAEHGVTPMQYLQTRRLLMRKAPRQCIAIRFAACGCHATTAHGSSNATFCAAIVFTGAPSASWRYGVSEPLESSIPLSNRPDAFWMHRE